MSWKLVILLIGTLIGLLLMRGAQAEVIDYFDDCSVGYLQNCAGWEKVGFSDGLRIVSSPVDTPPHSVQNTSGTTTANYLKPLATSTYQIVEARFYMSSENNKTGLLLLGSRVPGYNVWLGHTTGAAIALSHISTTTILASSFDYNVWHTLRLEYDLANQRVRGRFDNGSWVSIPLDPGFDYVNYVGLQGQSENIFWDTLNTGYVYTSFDCGQGLMLGLCATPTACVAEGGAWYNDYCWASSTLNLTTWQGYYDANSDYATATTFVQTIASSSQVFYFFMRDLALNFNQVFNASSAAAYGSTTGGIVPTLRGYLDLTNGLFNNIPVAQIFLLSILLMFGAIIWQVMKGIIGIIKP